MQHATRSMQGAPAQLTPDLDSCLDGHGSGATGSGGRLRPTYCVNVTLLF